MIVDKSKSRSRTTHRASNRKDHLEGAMKRRAVMEGFPIAPNHMSDKDLLEYFSGDKITCLRCGKNYKALGTHLRKIHNMDVYEYQVMYGIPLCQKLISATLHQQASKIAKDLQSKGIIGKMFMEDKNIRKNAGKHKRRYSPYNKNLQIKKLKKITDGLVKNYEKTCPTCGENFIHKREKVIYCSRKCYVEHQIKSGSLLEKSYNGGGKRSESAERGSDGKFK